MMLFVKTTGGQWSGAVIVMVMMNACVGAVLAVGGYRCVGHVMHDARYLLRHLLVVKICRQILPSDFADKTFQVSRLQNKHAHAR
jgi:hypothetical protein